MSIDSIDSLPLWVPVKSSEEWPPGGTGAPPSALNRAWRASMAIGELAAAISGRWPETPRSDWLQTQLIIISSTESGAGARFVLQDEKESRAVTIDVLGRPRLAPNAEISIGGATSDAPGPLIAVRYCDGRREQAMKFARAVAASGRDVNEEGVSFTRAASVRASIEEMSLAVEQLRAASATLSARCRGAFRDGKLSHGGIFQLAYLAVRPPPEELLLGPKPVGVLPPCQAVGCSEPGRLRCAGCKSAMYCSRECQKADWLAAHKAWCAKARAAATSSSEDGGSGAAAASEVASAVAGGIKSPLPRASVLLPAPSRSGGAFSTISMCGGPSRTTDSARHAPSYNKGVFVVKVQVGLKAGMPICVYDESKSFQEFHALEAEGVAALAALVRRQERHAGLKAYLWAQREADRLRVFTDEYAPSQTW